MVRYLETLFRHGRLLVVPVILVVASSAILLATRPPSYEADVRIWVEKPALGPTTRDNPYITPAEEQAAVINELLHTRFFCVKVGHRGPLAAALAAAPPQGPIENALVSYRVPGFRAWSAPTPDALDDELFNVVSKGVTVAPSGPEIVTVSFKSGDARVAAPTAQAVVDQFLDEVLAGQRAQAKTVLDFYAAQVAQTQSDLVKADDAVFSYLAAHPDQRSDSAIPDAQLLQLRRVDDLARQKYDGLQLKLEQAQINTAALNSPGAYGFRVLDPALTPNRATSQKRVALQVVGFGIALALTILLAGVLLLTLTDSSVRRPEELTSALGLSVVASAPRFKARLR